MNFFLCCIWLSDLEVTKSITEMKKNWKYNKCLYRVQTYIIKDKSDVACCQRLANSRCSDARAWSWPHSVYIDQSKVLIFFQKSVVRNLVLVPGTVQWSCYRRKGPFGKALNLSKWEVGSMYLQSAMIFTIHNVICRVNFQSSSKIQKNKQSLILFRSPVSKGRCKSW